MVYHAVICRPKSFVFLANCPAARPVCLCRPLFGSVDQKMPKLKPIYLWSQTTALLKNVKGFGTLSRFWFWYREEKIDDQRNLFMVLNDRQFTVFCREVGFVKIYAFLVLFCLAKYVSLLFLLLFPSLVKGWGEKLSSQPSQFEILRKCKEVSSSHSVHFLAPSGALFNQI